MNNMATGLGFKAVIFDLDGVITQTALVHSRAWKEMFDTYLKDREKRFGEPFRAFSHSEDYLPYVDGKPRYEGVKSFLESRGIILPYGDASDDVSQETYCGIGNRKNIVFNEILERDGVEVYDSTVALMHRLKQEGIRIGVASSSKNCEMVLKAAGLLGMVETRVDGVVSAELGLKGKPEPDIFTTAANNLGVSCIETVVVEDAISGVQAGKKGNFGLVLGLAREENAAELLIHGADIAVSDIAEIGFEGICAWFERGLEEDMWSLVYHGFHPSRERSREALLSVGNGYFGTRGALEESVISDHHYPGTYLAGGYNRLVSQVSGREIENEDLVNFPNWLPLTFSVDDGEWLDLSRDRILNLYRRLDLRTSVLHKVMETEDSLGRRTRITSRRLASMDQPHLACISYVIKPLNYSARIRVKSCLSADHINDGVKRYAELNQHHLAPVSEWVEGPYQFLEAKTTQSNIHISLTARLNVSLDGRELLPAFESHGRSGVSECQFSVEVREGESLETVKTVCIQASHLPSFIHQNPGEFLEQLPSFDQLLSASTAAWQGIWDNIDIRLQGDRLSQKLLRLHLYHLMSTFSPHNENIDFSIPARGLTGEAYRGHIFWDELYILPLYFMHFPELARSALMYRYRRLEEARNYAAEFGYQGAMFPWQSGSNGREETQRFHFNPVSGKWDPDYSSFQRHVNLAIAYNILQYHHYTQDEDFMLDYGAEMLIEICRLWSSKAKWNPEIRRFTIAQVMGPDEFHEHGPGSDGGGLKDNAYTNVMTAWMMKQTLEWLDGLADEKRTPLLAALQLTSGETQRWAEISSSMNLIINKEGIIAQFDGYFDLQEVSWEEYRTKYGNVYRMDRILKAEGKTPDEFKVAKQADTLMLFYNLDPDVVTGIIRGFGYDLPADYVERNLRYYLQRTSHGSTLSRVVHAHLANIIGDHTLSWNLYHEALGSDYQDIQGGTTAEGIHTGVMAGTVLVALHSLAGIDCDGDILKVNPNLPIGWKSLGCKLSFRNIHYQLLVSADHLSVCADEGTRIEWKGKTYALQAGQWLHL